MKPQLSKMFYKESKCQFSLIKKTKQSCTCQQGLWAWVVGEMYESICLGSRPDGKHWMGITIKAEVLHYIMVLHTSLKSHIQIIL